MELNLAGVLCMIPGTVCAGAAGWLCYKDRDGWGWFLFVAFLLFSAGISAMGGEWPL